MKTSFDEEAKCTRTWLTAIASLSNLTFLFLGRVTPTKKRGGFSRANKKTELLLNRLLCKVEKNDILVFSPLPCNRRSGIVLASS